MKPQRFQHPIALALVALVLPATGDIIYSGYKDLAIPADFDGLFLNVEDGTWNVYPDPPPPLPPEHHLSAGGPIAGVTGWDINPFYGGSVVANSPDFQPVRSGNLATDAVVNLATGTTVNSGSTYSTFVQLAGGENVGGPGYGMSDATHLGVGAGKFVDGSEGHLGFQLNGTQYGWMRVVFTNNTGPGAIKDWAFDNSTGSIVVGRVRQDAPVGLTQNFNLYPDLGESFTLGSAIADSPGLIVNSVEKTDDGTVTLGATNTYTGVTKISGGVLAVAGIGDGGVAGNLGQATAASANLVLNGGTLRYTGSTASTNRGMTFNNTAGNAIDISSGSANLTISGDLTGLGGFTKSGDGTLTLSGSSTTYAGETIVADGTLLVDGLLGAGGVTVKSGATLGGDGSIGGTVTADAGSSVAPGASIGSLGLADLDLFGSLIIEWDSGANFDVLNATNLDLKPGSKLVFSGSTTLTGAVYVFANYASLVGDPFAPGDVFNLPTGYTIDYSYNGSSIALVPESSTSLLAALATLGLALRRRRA